MSDFQAIDALLASASSDRTPLPPAEERRQLREGPHLSRAQLAMALDVGASTVGGWESGRDPSGEVRDKYAYFLEEARTKLDAAAATATAPVGDPADAAAEADRRTPRHRRLAGGIPRGPWRDRGEGQGRLHRRHRPGPAHAGP